MKKPGAATIDKGRARVQEPKVSTSELACLRRQGVRPVTLIWQALTYSRYNLGHVVGNKRFTYAARDVSQPNVEKLRRMKLCAKCAEKKKGGLWE